MKISSEIQAEMTKGESTDRINKALSDLAGATQTHETVASGIRDHEQTYYAKPVGSSYGAGADIFARAADEEKQIEPYVVTFNYRPWDVALAFSRVWERTYGHPPFAKRGETAQVEIPVGPNEKVKIPFGTFDVPELKGTVQYDDTTDKRLGVIGRVIFYIPKMLHSSAEGLGRLVADDLKVNSIYKGKAITSDSMPKFLNPFVTNAANIVWSRPVDASMRGSLLNVIRYTDRAKSRGQQIHRSVLMYGEPGNGKSETINIVAQACVQNGWTYVLATGSLMEAMQTARLLAPAVISVEDLERMVAEASPDERSALLEELDGTSSKGQDIMLVATTNYINDLEKAVRRRMFKEIEFGPFDVPGAERFLRIKLRDQSAPDAGNTHLGVDDQLERYDEAQRTTLDFAEVASAMDGWGNSYISKVTDFAAGLALEHDDPELTTADLLDAVEAQRSDWEGYQAAQSRPTPNKFDAAFKSILTEALVGDVQMATPMGVGDFVAKV
jgi:ATPases of the AAA+ class